VFEQFTDRARRSLLLGQEAAIELGHTYLGCEHLLLGLIKEGSGVAAVVLAEAEITEAAVRDQIVERVGAQAPSAVTDADALASLGIDLNEVHRQLEASFGKAGLPPSRETPPFTPRAKASLERAVAESDKLQHGYVGQEHLLLALLVDDGNLAASILGAVGADLVRIREATLELAAADYLRLRRVHERHDRLFRIVIDPATRAAIEPIYYSMSQQLAAAHQSRARAMRDTAAAFVEASEAAVSAAERAAADAGLVSTDST
jgi:ATP-dependent Clp protease ATP-binding subunit ClpC